MTAETPAPDNAAARVLERPEGGRLTEWEQSPPAPRPRRKAFLVTIAILLVAGGAAAFMWRRQSETTTTPAAPASAPAVTVGLPLAKAVATRTVFLGQFSALDAVEIRAQVGGVLTEIHYKDGQTVQKGDLLFVIDQRPYEIRLSTAVASLRTAQAQAGLAQVQLWRAQQLKQTSFGTTENVDQRASELAVANAAVDTANSNIRNATLDFEYSHVSAPFTGRVSNHRVSIGSLVSGSRAGTSPTTLLTTIVSTDPIYLNFDMSENDYLAFARAHPNGGLNEQVDFRLGDEETETRHGTLDFIDNELDRSAGTIHARAICPNPGGFIEPGSFARLSLVTGQLQQSLLVPETAMQLDQSNYIVMTVSPDDIVAAKVVTIGGLHDGMRVITSGLAATDRVIVDGLSRAIPGQKVAPHIAAPSSKG